MSIWSLEYFFLRIPFVSPTTGAYLYDNSVPLEVLIYPSIIKLP